MMPKSTVSSQVYWIVYELWLAFFGRMIRTRKKSRASLSNLDFPSWALLECEPILETLNWVESKINEAELSPVWKDQDCKIHYYLENKWALASLCHLIYIETAYSGRNTGFFINTLANIIRKLFPRQCCVRRLLLIRFLPVLPW